MITATNRAVQNLYNRFDELAQRASWIDLQGNFIAATGPSVSLEGWEDYWQDRLELASDPAKGDKIDKTGLEEAAVAMHAMFSGVLRKPERESTGHSEFVDRGELWDVKSPVSPLPGAHWTIDVQHQVDVVKKEVNGDEKVLLNLTRCNDEDAEAVRQALIGNLTEWESQRLVILRNNPEPIREN